MASASALFSKERLEWFLNLTIDEQRDFLRALREVELIGLVWKYSHLYPDPDARADAKRWREDGQPVGISGLHSNFEMQT